VEEPEMLQGLMDTEQPQWVQPAWTRSRTTRCATQLSIRMRPVSSVQRVRYRLSHTALGV
jgi:hypothetical protein